MKNFNVKSVLLFLIIIWVIVIFSFSLAGGKQSHHESNSVKFVLSSVAKNLDLHINHKFYNIYKPFVENKDKITGEDFVRKTAHFTEYFMLGILSGIVAIILKRKSKFWYASLFIGIPVALFDEKFIQKFMVPGRTSSLRDALLDNIGFYFAVIIVIFANFIYKKVKVKWNNQ